jgi:hypothetical protein
MRVGKRKREAVADVNDIKLLIEQCSDEQLKQIFQYLRTKIHIHPIEEKLNCKAEIILEAIDRASDLTLRGIRGIIAESAFKYEVLEKTANLNDVTPNGNDAFDFEIEDAKGRIKIQVKMQRQKNKRPMTAKEGYKILSPDMFVVETQRTRGGKDPRTGADTRPYRFGEFDLLAVSMHPSTNDWSSFKYTVARWLLPRPDNANLLLKFQPVAKGANDDWTDDLVTCIGWFRTDINKKIAES